MLNWPISGLELCIIPSLYEGTVVSKMHSNEAILFFINRYGR